MPNSKQKSSKRGKQRSSFAQVCVLLALICVLSVIVYKNATIEPQIVAEESPVIEQPVVSTEPETPTPVASPVSSLPEFNPQATDSTRPEALISETAIMSGDQAVTSYSFDTPIDFGLPEDYTDVQGIVTFRGNNFRDSASYGTASVVNKCFSDNYWTVQTSSLQSPNGTVWTGSGWVGQPLMMTWPKEVRAHMNMYDWAKTPIH